VFVKSVMGNWVKGEERGRASLRSVVNNCSNVTASPPRSDSPCVFASAVRSETEAEEWPAEWSWSRGFCGSGGMLTVEASERDASMLMLVCGRSVEVSFDEVRSEQ